jgi:hypothetical protein
LISEGINFNVPKLPNVLAVLEPAGELCEDNNRRSCNNDVVTMTKGKRWSDIRLHHGGKILMRALPGSNNN